MARGRPTIPNPNYGKPYNNKKRVFYNNKNPVHVKFVKDGIRKHNLPVIYKYKYKGNNYSRTLTAQDIQLDDNNKMLIKKAQKHSSDYISVQLTFYMKAAARVQNMKKNRRLERIIWSEREGNIEEYIHEAVSKTYIFKLDNIKSDLNAGMVVIKHSPLRKLDAYKHLPKLNRKKVLGWGGFLKNKDVSQEDDINEYAPLYQYDVLSSSLHAIKFDKITSIPNEQAINYDNTSFQQCQYLEADFLKQGKLQNVDDIFEYHTPYLKENFKENTCVVSSLLEFFGTNKNLKNLTYDKLMDKNEDITNCGFKKLKEVCEKLGKQCEVYDRLGKKLLEYEPTKLDTTGKQKNKAICI